RAGPAVGGAFAETLVEGWDGPSQELGEKLPGPRRSAHRDDAPVGDAPVGGGIRRVAGGAAGGGAALSHRGFRLIGAEYLIAEGIGAVRRGVGGDRTRADDLTETRSAQNWKGLARGAGEAKAAVALTVGHGRRLPASRIHRPRAGVDGGGPALDR